MVAICLRLLFISTLRFISVVLGVQFSLRAGLQRVEITQRLAVLIFPKGVGRYER